MKRARLQKPLAVLMALLASGCGIFQPAITGPDVGQSAPAVKPTIPSPQASAAEVPAGYRVEVFLRDLTYPTSLEFGDAGEVYVAEAGYVYGDNAGPARVLRVAPDGAIDVVAEQLQGPVTDLLWHRGALYVSHRGKISVLEAGGRVRDLVTGLPSLGDHHNNQMTIGPDGKLYFGQGTVTNSGVVGLDNFLFLWLPLHPGTHDVSPRDVRLAGGVFETLNPFLLGELQPPVVTTAPFQPFGQGAPDDDVIRGTTKANACILRMNLDGSDLEVYAWGLRNPFGVLWAPDGRLYASVNEYDERGSRPVANAPDCLYAVKPGGWYGWPDYAAGIPLTDPRFKPEDGPQPEFLLAEHPPVESPLLAFEPHAGVTKLEAGRGGPFGFDGWLFLAMIGDMNPITGEEAAQRAGFQVVAIDPRTGRVETLFRARRDALGRDAMAYVVTPGPKRPIDVRMSPDGSSLYVVDLGALAALPTTVPMPMPFEGTGVVWRIVREGAPDPSPPGGLSLSPGHERTRARPAGYERDR